MITSKFIRFAYVAVALCAAVCVKVCVGAEVPQVTGTKPADMEQRFWSSNKPDSDSKHKRAEKRKRCDGQPVKKRSAVSDTGCLEQ